MLKKFGLNNTILVAKMEEALKSVLPITAIVFAVSFALVPVPAGALLAFVFGSILLIVGMGLFTIGADIAMTPIGQHIGSAVTRTRSLWFILLISFLVGSFITVSEPDLQVLAGQVPNIPNAAIIGSVALGVGLFLLIAMLRIFLAVRLQNILLVFYALIIVLAFFIPVDYIGVAFDSGGVTTGPMTVPFIMALGVGVAATRSDGGAQNDSFGLVAISSIGPILAVLILGLLYPAGGSEYTPVVVPDISDSQELWNLFAVEFPRFFHEIAISVLPIVLFFLAFQIFKLKLYGTEMIQITAGILYTYLGLVLFLTGVNVGFMPVGNYIGQLIGGLAHRWVIVPIGMVIGYFIVMAEPAVHVLNKQVVEITAGAIPKKAMSVSLSIGVSISVGLAMMRILTGLPLMWLIVPGYALALLLSFFVPPIFTAIAFDSGGVASGAMTATFLLPLAMGLCSAVGGNITQDAFGVVAMVAMTPLITIQLLGLLYARGASAAKDSAPRL
ncbi:MAG: DUF1538 domain-containing protein [Synergistaceae bacterium]|nr:DUF1538 domain-containing protein [Synergistaceae bacterium]